MKYGGFTAMFYSNVEYAKMSTKINALVLSLFTILVLFFMWKPSLYFESTTKTKQKVLHVAGFAGMTYAAMASIDGFIRSKFEAVRVVDELGIVAAYVCLWCLLGLIFEVATIYFGLSYFVITVLGSFGLTAYYNSQKKKPTQDELRKQRFANLLQALSTSDSGHNALTTMSIFAVFNYPDDPMTEQLVQAAMQVVGAA